MSGVAISGALGRLGRAAPLRQVGLEAYPGQFSLSKRQRQIVERVRDQGFVTVEALAEEFDTSTQTVRREIIRLSEAGVLQRFHGGAGLPDGAPKPARASHLDDGADSMLRVGAVVAGLVPDGATVFLDAGAMAQAVGHSLAGHRDLRIVTNSPHAGLSVGWLGASQVQLTGGELRGADGALVGAQAIESLQDIRVGVAVIACAGFDGDGAPMDFDGETIAVKRAAIRVASQVIVTADAARFSRAALMRIVPASSIGVVAASAEPPPRLAEAFAAARVRVVVG